MVDTSFTTPPSQQGVDPSLYHPDTRIIAAIDFGTTHSGFATAHVDDKIIDCFREWQDQPTYYSKTLTSILYLNVAASNTIESWGYTARRAAKTGNHLYYERFKLYLDKVISRQMPPLPVGVTALDMISDYLTELHTLFKSNLRIKYGGMYDRNSIAWVLTVPAMWDEEAKQLMAKAAVRAGLVSAEDVNDKRKFVLVLEPEAAAMQCCELAGQNNLKPGDKFVIVDAGGGTVDLTAYRIAQDQGTGLESLRELGIGIGDTCGATFVDEHFFMLLKERCGEQAVDRFQERHPTSWITLVQAWEVVKRQFQGITNNNDVKLVQVPMPLLRLMPQDKREYIEDECDGQIELTADDMLKLFDPVVGKVIALINSQLLACQPKLSGTEKIDKLFLVGGFASNNYLFQRIQTTFPHITVTRPVDPGSAIMAGAVLCGINPRFIKSRCARFTYGVLTSGKWTPDNPGGKQVQVYNEDAGTTFATNLFHAMVKKGDEIGIDDHVNEQFAPTEYDQRHAKMEFYQTDLIDCRYLVPSMKKIAELHIPILGSVSDAEVPKEGQMPIRINIVQDVSGSMDGDKLTACIAGIKEICSNLNDDDEVGLISFDSSVDILSDLGTNPGSPETIERLAEGLMAGSTTALWDGILAGHRTLANAVSRSRNFRNILIVMTDGGECSSSAKFSKVIDIVERPEMPRFNFFFAYAGETNQELVNLCQSPACSPYCKVIPVEDSKIGVAEAYTTIRHDVQLFRKSENQALGNKVVNLRLKFGESMVTALAVNEVTGKERQCDFQFTSYLS